MRISSTRPNPRSWRGRRSNGNSRQTRKEAEIHSFSRRNKKPVHRRRDCENLHYGHVWKKQQGIGGSARTGKDSSTGTVRLGRWIDQSRKKEAIDLRRRRPEADHRRWIHRTDQKNQWQASKRYPQRRLHSSRRTSRSR